MSSRLDQVTDWAALAKATRYCAARLAGERGLTTRQLERYFQAKHRETPHHWLRALRLRRAAELIRDHRPLKKVWPELGYKDASHFAHDFKQYFGVSPSAFGRNPSCPVPIRQNVAF